MSHYPPPPRLSHHDLPHRTCSPSQRHLSDISVTPQCPPFVHKLRTCPPSYMPTPARLPARMSHSMDVAFPTTPSTFPPRPSPSHEPTISPTSHQHLSDIPMPAFRTHPSHVPTIVHAHQPATVGCRILWMSHFPVAISAWSFPTTTFPIARAHHLTDISATPQ